MMNLDGGGDAAENVMLPNESPDDDDLRHSLVVHLLCIAAEGIRRSRKAHHHLCVLYVAWMRNITLTRRS